MNDYLCCEGSVTCNAQPVPGTLWCAAHQPESPAMRERLIEALTEMPEPATADCWFCGIKILFPTDEKGLTPIDEETTCTDCGSISQTTEDENDDGSPVVSLAPVRCGHGIDHDEHCARCDAPDADCTEAV